MNVREHEGSVSFEVCVSPRASRAAIVGLHAGALKVSLTAAPVDGAANSALIELLGDALEVPRSAIRIVRGEHARTKVVSVAGLDAQALLTRVAAACSASDAPGRR